MIGFTVSLHLVRRFKMPLSSGTHNNKAIAGATYQKSKDVFTFPSIPRAQVLLKPVDYSHETFPLDSAGALLINPLCRFACIFLTYIMQAKILKYTEINKCEFLEIAILFCNGEEISQSLCLNH